MAREAFKKISTTLLRYSPSDVGGWTGKLDNHRNLVNHQLAIVASNPLAAGRYEVWMVPDGEDSSVGVVNTGKVLDLTGTDNDMVVFSGVLKGIHLRVATPFDAGQSISIVLSSYTHYRYKEERTGRLDYVSTELFSNRDSDAGSFSKEILNHNNMVYHQLGMSSAEGQVVSGKYKVRIVLDDSARLETSVDTGYELEFDNNSSALARFGAVLRGIVLEEIDPVPAGNSMTAIMSSSVERFDEIVYDYIGSDPGLTEHLNDFNNPHNVTWDQVLNKPTEFPPEEHDHNQVEWLNAWFCKFYEKNNMVWDSPYTMIARDNTYDRAAPIPLMQDPVSPFPNPYLVQFANGDDAEFTNGDPVEYATPEWLDVSDASVIWSGHRYTFTEDGEIRSIRVWVPEYDITGSTINYYRFVVVHTHAEAGDNYMTFSKADLVADAWNEITINPLLVRAGEELLVYIDALKSGSETTFTDQWYTDFPSKDDAPLGGTWNRNHCHSIVRVSTGNFPSGYMVELGSTVEMEVELGSTVVFDIEIDFTASLLALGVDSTLRFTDLVDTTRWFEYLVIAPPTDLTSYVEFPVRLVDERNGGLITGNDSTLLGTYPVRSAASYVKIDGHWTGEQPFYATAEAYLAYDGVEQTVPADDGYGVDIYFRHVSASPMWDVVHMP
jgi:hypothetical protein